MSAAREAILELLTSTLELVDALEAIDQQHLACTSSHVCAYGGDVEQLIANLIDHEDEHFGQLAAARHHPPGIRTRSQRLTGEWMEARTRFATQLIGMSDKQFHAPMREGEWSYQNAVRHLVDLQRDCLKSITADAPARAPAEA